MTADLSQSRSERRERLAAILLVVAAAISLQLLGIFEPVEHRLTEARARLLDRPPTGQVVIVEIDAKSLKQISTWPWSRRYHAEALRRLHASGAELIAFDVDFSSPSQPTPDRTFAEALKRAQPTILPIFQQRASDDPSQDAVVRSRPAPMFDASLVGGVNIFPQSDGVVRDYPAATMIGGRIQPSLATLLADNDDFGDRTFEPDWSIDAGRIPRLSFVDVIKGRVPSAAIAGKRIVIGATAVELGDRYTVPRFGTVPGVVVQALAADSLLQKRALTRTGMVPSLLGILLAALVLGVVRYRRFARTFPFAAAALLAVLGAAPVIVESRWPYAMDSAAMLFCGLGCIGVRMFLEGRRRARLSTLVDFETKLPNRRALQNAMQIAESHVVVAAGMDRFEVIRDAIGSAALAELVRQAASRIERTVGCPVYRIAPDCLAWIEGADRAAVAAEAVALLFREPVRTGEGVIDISFTIGLNRSPGNMEDAASPVEGALASIGSARAAGKTFSWYEGADPGAKRRLSMMGELRRGIENGEVAVMYQPQLDLRLGAITHAEALVRWHHPVHGIIGPDQFIPLAESTGVVRELTEFVLGQVAANCAQLKAGGRTIRFAINVSAADVGHAAFVDSVVHAIRNSGADPASLTLEITESAIINSPQAAIGVLTALRDVGVQLSIDDYGTGQSTLSYLKQLPVHELKIDRSFVTSICENDNDLIMVRSTIHMAHELGLRVVAEGVEDAPTLRLLRSLDCDIAQGYFIGRAMSAEDLLRLSDSRDAPLRQVA